MTYKLRHSDLAFHGYHPTPESIERARLQRNLADLALLALAISCIGAAVWLGRR